MGSGKTTVGRLLSNQLGYRFIDVDQEIEQDTGQSIPHIFTYGESYFRTVEAEMIGKVCRFKRAVIATGGGVVKNAGNVGLLRQSGAVFYLKWPLGDLYDHVKGSTNRPLINVPNPLEEMRALLAEREPLYLSAAHIVIECNGKDTETIANEIEERNN